MEKTLAVVIPAYKPDYLEKTLQSLAEQTDHSFSVYIGDDASPADLYRIVRQFSHSLNLYYYHFDNNLGKDDLVAHWDRCIQMCQEEEWICLFSDDDIMEKGCIEAFHRNDIPDTVDVVHFDLGIINSIGSTVQTCPTFPTDLSASEFFNLLFRRKIVARMPEFIFRKKTLQKKGFIHFDLAWRSDTATVINLATDGGIMTISGPSARILWRISDSNISGIDSLKKRKNNVNLLFFNWAYDFFTLNPPQPMSKLYLLKTIVFALEYTDNRTLLTDGWIASRKLSFASGFYSFSVIIFTLYRLVYRIKENYASNEL